MEKERIDLTQFKEMDVTSMPIWYSKIPDLVAELKRCYEKIDSLTSIECTICDKSYNESDYGIKYHRITVPDDSLMYEYREDMQEHCIECITPDEAIEKNCSCDLCQQYHEEQSASE